MSLKELLNSRGFTVYRFAKEAGVAMQTAYDLVNGTTKIENISTLITYKFSRTLGMSMEEFLKTIEVID